MFEMITYTEKNMGVYLKKTVVELTKIFIKTQPTTLVVELMNKILKSHFVINLTNLFVNITKKIHYVNDAAFVDLTHLFVNPTKNFYKIFFGLQRVVEGSSSGKVIFAASGLFTCDKQRVKALNMAPKLKARELKT